VALGSAVAALVTVVQLLGGMVILPRDTFSLSALNAVPSEANSAALFAAGYNASEAGDSARANVAIQLARAGTRRDTLLYVRGASAPGGAVLVGYEAFARRVGTIRAGETLKVVLGHAAPGLVQQLLAGTQLPALDSARLIADLSALAADSMEGRRIGTPGGARARAFLVREFTRIGLDSIGDRIVAPFTAKGAGAELNGVNVVGMIRGTRHPDRYVVLSAHYDHLGVRGGVIYNGADDNASGTAAVLMIAQWFKTHPPENSVIVALFDGEEEGLLGSKAFLATAPVPIDRIMADVNLDMVSRNEKGELYASGSAPYPVTKPLLDSIAAIAPVKLRLGHDTGVGENNWIQQSDQGPFATKKIPFVYFGVEDHPDYHKPGDKVEHIEPGFYYHSVQTIAEFVRRLDAGLDRVEAVRRSKD
jgi:hypothetical protein